MQVTRKVEFRSIFCAPSQKFKILAIPNVLAHGELYEHGFTKNAIIINFAQSHTQVPIDFSCTISKIQNTGHSQRISPWEVVRARFREKNSYEHGFMKKNMTVFNFAQCRT
ncbi:hypothetical protein BHM03_00003766 [Ensete ventricosum]|uniref:Uncharacterized protein n=1 Tax=Ensete ventricosum TaxID=4639 RepID=A0A445MA49_ENSVE|nr:hypothetical protein BHM03_00003766 [Ensete ventricosum]